MLARRVEAEILSLGRSKDRHLTAHVRIRNLGKNSADLLLVGRPLATENTDGIFNNLEKHQRHCNVQQRQ